MLKFAKIYTIFITSNCVRTNIITIIATITHTITMTPPKPHFLNPAGPTPENLAKKF